MKEEERILAKLQAYCVRAERCRADIKRKLMAYADKLDAATQNSIIESLIAERFLDEERFARAFARDKYRFNGWGPRKIAAELYSRSIAAALIEDALASLCEGEDALPDPLEELMTTKLRSIKAKDNRERYQKLIRWALGRGFDYADCKKTATKLLGAEDFEENNSE